MKPTAIVAALAMTALSAHSYGQAPEEPLQAEVELGLLLTSGNANSTAISSRIQVRQELARWRNQYMAQGLYKEDELRGAADELDESVVTAERYFLSAQSDYKLNLEQRALFVFGSYTDDRFSGYDYQAAFAAGYSDRLFESANAFLDYSVGPGISIDRLQDQEDADGVLVLGEREASAMVRLSGAYEYRFSDNAKFTQTLASDVALESDANIRSISVSAITANLNASFALKASLTITHNSEVPAARENTDTVTSLSLVYSL